MVELQFAEAEAELIRKQTSIKAEKTILMKKKAISEAQTTLEAMELALNGESSIEESDTRDRVLDYVAQQSDLVAKQKPEEVEESVQPAIFQENTGPFTELPDPPSRVGYDMTPRAESTPRIVANSRRTEVYPDVTDISQYLAKRDLISSRFTMFDDTPTNYYAWKVHLKNILSDLQVTPLEYLDIMVKWLGPESQRQAKSIRAANIANPQTAIDLIWERLDSRYDSPEVIEDSLQCRLAKLPRLTFNSRKEYFDLLDLATEILAIKKDDENKTLFSYFDSSHGVNKLVCKFLTIIRRNGPWKFANSSRKIKDSIRHSIPLCPIFRTLHV